MNRIQTLMLIVMMLVLGTASTGSVVVLHADFNADTIGGSPSSNPPGEPDGDSLTVYD